MKTLNSVFLAAFVLTLFMLLAADKTHAQSKQEGIVQSKERSSEITITEMGTSSSFSVSNSSGDTLLIVKDGGNVGIGTTSPGQALDVSGSVHASTALIVGATPASAGIVRIPNAQWISARNLANDADINIIRVSTSGLLEFGAPLDAPHIRGVLDVGLPATDITFQALRTSGSAYVFRSNNASAVQTNRLLIDAGTDTASFAILNSNVGIGTTSPSNPLEMGSGAHVTAGGVWTDASSREYKENIRDLTVEEAIATLEGLEPRKFNYKVDKQEEHVGFIAEDVPELVASKGRKGLSPMDVVAVLTKVVQQQQEKIEELQARLNDMQ